MHDRLRIDVGHGVEKIDAIPVDDEAARGVAVRIENGQGDGAHAWRNALGHVGKALADIARSERVALLDLADGVPADDVVRITEGVRQDVGGGELFLKESGADAGAGLDGLGGVKNGALIGGRFLDGHLLGFRIGERLGGGGIGSGNGIGLFLLLLLGIADDEDDANHGENGREDEVVGRSLLFHGIIWLP